VGHIRLLASIEPHSNSTLTSRHSSRARADAEVVVEELLAGQEVSFFALCNGLSAIPLATAQDHKRAFDGDRGPNTGGMGAYSPSSNVDAAMSARVMDEIVLPTLRALKRMGASYEGVLYTELMITPSGPKLIEYNVRFGDPECQVLMLRLRSDLVPALLATCDGQLESLDLRWSDQWALAVVMAAKGYPEHYQRGSVIEGLDAAAAVDGVEIFHADTKADGARILANGGRVLNVCALGKSLREAQSSAYEAIARIQWPDGFYRRDIGWRAMEK
jgi:phosphoribosylamine---glycine ligase